VEARLEEDRAHSCDGRELLTLAEAGERLGCSRGAARMLVRRGRLDSRHVGRRLYVTADSLNRLADRR
jgi:excisionase family DNA binding protein